jgi:hypothetical protein
MSRRAEYLLLAAYATVSFIMLGVGVHPGYIVAAVLAMALILPMFFGKVEQVLHVSKYGHELEEPFLAEVMLDGQPVATISDRVVTEMFWRTYRITPLTQELANVATNDDLWETCRFTFRDPVSQEVCLTGFCGGSRPYVREGSISLRGLYFLPEKQEKTPDEA